MAKFTLTGLFKPIKDERKNALGSSLSPLIILWSMLMLCYTCNAHVVKVENGFLRGDEAVSKNGRKYYEFCGIPFAAPPVGDLRFKSPQSPSSWKGVRTSQRPPSCIQPSGTNKTKGQEDCLYLNVYSPRHILAISHKLSVMVFLHGGGFKYGDGFSNNPKYFMASTNPVIFVTFNHRLGPLGFLSMNNDKLPGNYGLKDQLMALKWVKRNIKAFGGNPNSVTLMGHSTGAISLELHLLSEKSRGLFHKAIGQSGILLSSYGFHYPNEAKAVGINFILKIGCFQDDANKTLACLHQYKAELLVQLSAQNTSWGCNSEPIFRPTLEYYGDFKDRFLSADPRKSQYLSKVPYLHGITAAEGVLVAIEFLKNNLTLLKVLNETYPQLLPVVLDFNHMVNATKNYEKIAKDIIKFYFGNGGIHSDKISQLVQLFTDAIFVYSTVKSVWDQNVSHYIYVFDHQSWINSFQQKVLPEYKNKLGTGYSDDLLYYFYSESTDKNMTEADKKLSETMITYWTTFATYGNPDGMSKDKTWTMVKSTNVEYLLIESGSQKMQTGLANDRIRFWNSIFNHN